MTIASEEYALAGPLYDTQLEDNAMAATAMVIIAPDEAVEALKAAGCIPDTQYLNVMYADNGKTAGENDAAIDDIVAALQPRDMGGFEKGTQGADDPYASLLWPVTRILTRTKCSPVCRLRLMITYLALYIGFVFLISTAAILAIQQLSQASDSTPRYRILWKLGCDRGMIYRSLLAQVLVYFLVPLGLAVCHSVCAIGVLSDSLLDAIGVSSAGPIMMAAALTLVIYGGYMLVTYLAARGIVKTALRGVKALMMEPEASAAERTSMEYQQLQDEIKAAMKARDNHRRDILRQVHTELKAIEVNERREVTEADVDAMLKRTIKQTKETLDGSIKAGNNQERTDTLTEQVAILEEYLPRQVEGDELAALIDEVLADTGASTKKDMGRVMGELTKRTGGNFDKAAAAKELGSKLG